MQPAKITKIIILICLVFINWIILVGCGMNINEKIPDVYQNSTSGLEKTPELYPKDEIPTATAIDKLNLYEEQPIVDANITKLELTSQISQPDAYSFVWFGAGFGIASAAPTQISVTMRDSLIEAEALSDIYDYPTNLVVSRDGAFLAWSAGENQVYIWNIQADNPPIEIQQHESPVTSLALSQQGDMLAVARYDGSVEIWDTSTLKILSSWDFDFWMEDLSISPDGAYFAGTDKGNFTVYLTTIEYGKIVKILEWTEHASPVLYEVSISPDWDTLAWVARGTVQLMDLETGSLAAALHHEDFIGANSWSPDSLLFATSAAATVNNEFSPVVHFWDVSSGDKLDTISQNQATIDLNFSPNGGELGILDSEGNLYFWTIGE